MKYLSIRPIVIVVTLFAATCLGDTYSSYAGKEGPGKGKHVVLLAGDEEYRSEEALPMLAEILSERHGFDCSVLYSMNDHGFIDPANQKSLSSPEVLDKADAIIMSLRFRNWPDSTFEKFEAALHRGVPIVALRTSTHAFKVDAGPYKKYSLNSKLPGWERGFGRQVLGETWVNHHGHHGVEGTLGLIEAGQESHPILKGFVAPYGDTDVYGANPLEPSTILLRGQVLSGLTPDTPSVAGPKNNPMMPVAWTREYRNEAGTVNRLLTTTMGAATDLESEGLRRIVVNGVYWGLGLPVPDKADVSLVSAYEPSAFGFNGYKKNQRPPNLAGTPAVRPYDKSIAFIGGGLGSRMIHFNHFETELYARHKGQRLIIRNLCDEGDTPGFRPHPGRGEQFAFPGAREFRPSLTGAPGNGTFATPDQWLTEVKPDTIFAFFGFNASFDGPAGLEPFRKELDGFLKHTLAQQYGYHGAPNVILVSPTAIEDLKGDIELPDPAADNANLSAYTAVMGEVAASNNVRFVDLFSASQAWYAESTEPLTIDGALLNDLGYRTLASHLGETLFGSEKPQGVPREALLSAVKEKNATWYNRYKVPNGVHVYGGRHHPYGAKNYPFELAKLKAMTENRDQAIWAVLSGSAYDLEAADAGTPELPTVKTNYRSRGEEQDAYKSGQEALAHFKVPEGFHIELFASENEFPNLANPVQISFDNKGRLWVSTMPSYPHHKPGDPAPDDKILILEDTDGDGLADKETVFADKLHVPMGFEILEDGVYVSQGPNLVRLRDTDGDDKADVREVILSGFDDHDTHHAIGAFASDHFGSFLMSEGIFLRSNVETRYGPVRGADGGFFRYTPRLRKLDRYAQLDIPNPWGTAYDEWGQDFFIHGSSPVLTWMLPGTIRPGYGDGGPTLPNLLESSHRVRPNAGLEILSSRHFPEEMQGDYLMGNCIGFLGIKQGGIEDAGAGYTTRHRQDLVRSTYGHFRPVDLEIAPDGSLYLVDWHNILIGHAQHSARDPLRDRVHGRIYRITCSDRPLVEPAVIDGAPLSQLFENLTLPEYRSRFRTRRELRGRDPDKVMPALKEWAQQLDKTNERYEHHLLEAMWVSGGLNRIDHDLVRKLLGSEDHRVRAAAVRAVRHYSFEDKADLLLAAVQDDHGRVRLEGITAASRMPTEEGLPILQGMETPADKWSEEPYQMAVAHIQGRSFKKKSQEVPVPDYLNNDDRRKFQHGAKLYFMAENCTMCHAGDGQGIPAAMFPPLAGSEWVTGDTERLIKVVLNGVAGPIEVKGKPYVGAMPGHASQMDDREVAAVLTFIRNAFGNEASVIESKQVAKVRRSLKGNFEVIPSDRLLKDHPFEYLRDPAGPLVGAIEPDRVTLWMFALPESTCSYTYRSDDPAGPGAGGGQFEAVPNPASDAPGRPFKTTIEGLSPNTRYHYDVTVDGKTDPAWSGSFKTAPAAGKPAAFRLALTSCMHIKRRQTSWSLLLAQQPDFHLTVGDTHYADTTDPTVQLKHHVAYRRLPEFATVLRHIPTYAIWDDHDYGPNNSDGTAKGKENSLAGWKQAWANPALGTPDTPGAFFTFSHGDVDFFVVDGRYHRSPDGAPDDDQKRMLGDAQFAWLLDGLRNSQARFKVIVSGSTLDHSKVDGWRIYTFSRHRLFDALNEHRISGVMYMSGDMHKSLVWEHHESDRVGYPLVEVISSGVANGKALSFATVDFDTTCEDPTARVRIIHGDGTVHTDKTWTLSQLSPGQTNLPADRQTDDGQSVHGNVEIDSPDQSMKDHLSDNQEETTP